MRAWWDRMGIEKDIPFHNALDDALYTVRIARLLPLADALRAYPSPDAQLREALLTDPSANYYDVQIFPDGWITTTTKTTRRCAGSTARCAARRWTWARSGSSGATPATIPRPTARCTGRGFCGSSCPRRDGLHWNFARCIEVARPDALEKYRRQKARQEARLKKRSQEEGEGEAPRT